MNIWEGEFETFDQALKKSVGKGFTGKKWKDSQFRDFEICQKFYLKKKKTTFKNQLQIPKFWKYN